MTAPTTTRKHNPAWNDATRAARQQRRRSQLDAIARAAGYASWSQYETACIRGEVEILNAKPLK